MFDLIGNDETFNLLEATMDLASFRHTLISSNIANIDTPGYKAMDMAFSRELKIAIQQNRSNEFTGRLSGRITYRTVLRPRVFERTGVTARLDGNTVDIDHEMGQLSKTTSKFNLAAVVMGLKFKQLKAAINGGG